MRIIGIGTDLVQISRIENALQKRGQRFAQRILHSEEFNRFCAHAQPVNYLAKRFAAKEAVAKAMGTGIGKHVHLGEIETRNDEHGKPYLRLHGVTDQFARQQGISEVHLSLTDERDYALAYVILAGE